MYLLFLLSAHTNKQHVFPYAIPYIYTYTPWMMKTVFVHVTAPQDDHSLHHGVLYLSVWLACRNPQVALKKMLVKDWSYLSQNREQIEVLSLEIATLETVGEKMEYYYESYSKKSVLLQPPALTH